MSLDTETKAAIDGALKAFGEYKTSVEEIKKTKDELLKTSHKLAEEIYKAASQKTQTKEKEENGKAEGDNVVDAEVVDDQKKG